MRPPRVSNLMVIELSKKIPVDCSRRVPAIGGEFFFFGPRLIFDTVMRGQRSNFRKIDNVSTLHWHISKIINRSGLTLPSAYSPLNSDQNEVSLPFMDGLFVTHGIQEGNSVTLIGKIA